MGVVGVWLSGGSFQSDQVVRVWWNGLSVFGARHEIGLQGCTQVGVM